MNPNFWCRLLVGIVAFGSTSALAAPLPFTPDDVLQVRFTVSPNLSERPNLLQLNLGINTVTQKMDGFVASLFDGNQLLATHQSPWIFSGTGLRSMASVGIWGDTTNLWTFNSPAVVPFDSIADGSIDGRITFRIVGGQFNLDLDNVYLSLVYTTTAQFGASIEPSPTITALSIVRVPEPDSLALSTVAACALLTVLQNVRRTAGRTMA